MATYGGQFTLTNIQCKAEEEGLHRNFRPDTTRCSGDPLYRVKQSGKEKNVHYTG
uniref:hypothetical protein n=1 Tax=Escherichia coli TaxID=562 RepID=UPI00187F4F7E|nr:hypothetical protein [Escherichia coli]